MKSRPEILKIYLRSVCLIFDKFLNDIRSRLISVTSNISEDSAQASGGASYVDGRANQMETSYTERGASSRPKQARGSRKPFRPQYTKDYVEREGSGRTSAASYNNSYPPDYVSTSISSTSASLEHQPFENIRREYSKYKSRPPFEAQYEGRGDSRSTHEKYRRDERSGGYGSQERFPKGESTVNYAPRDRYGSEEPRVSTSSSKEQSSFNKPSRIYDSQNWRSEGFKKGISARTQKVSEAMADTAMQRERLTTQLTSGTYECMVCCESVKPVQVCFFFLIHSRHLDHVCLLFVVSFPFFFFSQSGIAVNVFMPSISGVCGVGHARRKMVRIHTCLHFDLIDY